MQMKVFFWFFLLLNAADSGRDSFIFNGFSGSNLLLDGTAEIKRNGLLMLNDETRHEKSHAFYPIPLHFKQSSVGNVVSFSTTFVFAIVPEYPAMGFNGFTFVLSPSKDLTMASPNQFLGLFNSTDNGNPNNHVLAIEFGTHEAPEFGDLNANHVGIDINSVRSNMSITAGYFSNYDGGFKNLSLISGDPMQVWIEYDGTDMQLNVTLSPLMMDKPVHPLLSGKFNLSNIILDTMYVGFSSSTGSIYSYHCILAWSFTISGQAQALNTSSLPAVPRIAKTSKIKQNILTIWLPFTISVLFLLIIAVVRQILLRKDKFSELLEDWELDFGPHRFSYKELYQATKGFKEKNLLGVGGFGKVYRGTLSSSKHEVAVKKVSYNSKQGVQQFVAEIVSLGKLRHKNLVQLLGYCRRTGELLLVYDYMHNGSLDKFIYDEDKNLSWEQRFLIIKGVASGLLYLHEDWEQVVIHRDVKASNVLLDNNMNAKLGDFGLARLYNHGTDPKTTHVVGTMGYIAPELIKYGKLTTRTDIFAFGVFLLEVACGRRPIEPTRNSNEMNLVDWVFHNWRKGTIIDTRDPKLGNLYVAEELEIALKLGLLCSHPVPALRPSMRQVVQFLDRSNDLPDLPLEFSSFSNTEGKKGTGFSNEIMSYPSLSPSNPLASRFMESV